MEDTPGPNSSPANPERKRVSRGVRFTAWCVSMGFLAWLDIDVYYAHTHGGDIRIPSILGLIALFCMAEGLVGVTAIFDAGKLTGNIKNLPIFSQFLLIVLCIWICAMGLLPLFYAHVTPVDNFSSIVIKFASGVLQLLLAYRLPPWKRETTAYMDQWYPKGGNLFKISGFAMIAMALFDMIFH